ncbi:MAG: hypothetical protein SGJ20_12700 [Planctomycetota bacterium]|nr:hypothetical protein [Planctomycetota bacterium]
MTKWLPAFSSCGVLSLLNVVGFFMAARYAEVLGFQGRYALGQFSLTMGMATMLLTSALFVWSAIDHFWIESTLHSRFTVALNLGFLCAFLAI